MEWLEEIKIWVAGLDGSEKRFITLLGKARAGAGGSQHLQLFDWLKKNGGWEELPQALRKQLPTLIQRLRHLIIDGLRLLDKGHHTASRLHAEMQAHHLLHQKGLLSPALRTLQRTETLAFEACRFDVVLQCCALLRQLELEKASGDSYKILEAIRLREEHALQELSALIGLRQQHDRLLTLGGLAMAARNSPFEQEVKRVKKSVPLEKLWKEGHWLARALAGNLLGFIDLFEKNHEAAMLRYRILLQEWEAAPERQRDEAALFLNLCKNYQNACFLHPQGEKEMAESLGHLPLLSHLPPPLAIEQQSMLYRARVLHILTQGRFELLPSTRPEIVSWIRKEGHRLGDAKTVVLLFNLAVAEFLHENFSEAARLVTQIQQVGAGSAREDILNFCRVFQAILHYEMEHSDLNEYLIRSARRHFSKKSHADKFELSVLKCLGTLSRSPSTAERKKAWAALETELDSIAEGLAAAHQIVGLMETRLWLRARQKGKPLQAVYAEALKG